MSRSRWRPPYPAAVVRARPCPSGRPRFASAALAGRALLHGLAHTGLTPVACDLCDGWHNRPARPAR